MSGYRVMVLGGYGHFGARICHRLARDARMTVLAAGRDPHAAAALVDELPDGRHEAHEVDCGADGLRAALRATKADLVIHAAGPFQGQDYRVARACLEVGCDYIDLADGRGFVEGFRALDAEARDAGRVLVSGASTVPAVTAAVVRAHAAAFNRLTGIRLAITPGQQTPRGRATVGAVLGYCGQPFRRWEGGRWRIRHGWQDLRRFPHPALGRRLWGACDVPDLGLFPARWPSLETVTFHAGLELRALQLGLWLGAALARGGLVRDWSRHAGVLHRAATWFDRFGTNHGGMYVGLEGVDETGARMGLDWWLTAWHGDGPFIPCVPAIALARQMAAGQVPEPGAGACLESLSLHAFADEVSDRHIEWCSHWRDG